MCVCHGIGSVLLLSWPEIQLPSWTWTRCKRVISAVRSCILNPAAVPGNYLLEVQSAEVWTGHLLISDPCRRGDAGHALHFGQAILTFVYLERCAVQNCRVKWSERDNTIRDLKYKEIQSAQQEYFSQHFLLDLTASSPITLLLERWDVPDWSVSRHRAFWLVCFRDTACASL